MIIEKRQKGNGHKYGLLDQIDNVDYGFKRHNRFRSVNVTKYTTDR